MRSALEQNDNKKSRRVIKDSISYPLTSNGGREGGRRYCMTSIPITATLLWKSRMQSDMDERMLTGSHQNRGQPSFALLEMSSTFMISSSVAIKVCVRRLSQPELTGSI
jgi:hypothetical protein